MEKKKFKLFDMNRDGKGVEKKDEGPKNLKFFFKLFGRKFTKLMSLTLLMDLMILPVAIGIALFIKSPTVQIPDSPLFPTLYGASAINGSPCTDLMLVLNSPRLAIPVHNSYIFYVIGAMALAMVITFGWQNAACTYILRNLVTGDPVFMISDYFYAIKKNLKQGFLTGLLDSLIIFALGVDIAFFANQPNTAKMNIMYAGIVALIFLYGIMRPYIYLQIVTFNLKLRKIIKNAFIFTALGIKRNLMAVLGIATITVLNGALIIAFIPLNFPLPWILPFFYYLATVGFMFAYAAYPVIEKYMIEPDTAEKSDEGDEPNEGDTADKKEVESEKFESEKVESEKFESVKVESVKVESEEVVRNEVVRNEVVRNEVVPDENRHTVDETIYTKSTSNN